MAAPVQPVPSDQPGQSGRVIRSAESPSPTTPPTNQPPAPPTEGGAPAQPGASVTPPTPQEPTREQRLIASQEALLREQQQELARLRQGQREIEGRVRTIENPPPSRESQNDRFWKDPVGVMNELIQSELKRTVEPINSYIAGQRTETAYDRMKAELRTQFSDVWPHIEREIDRFVQATAEAGNEVNPQLLNVAALAATGAYHRGLLSSGAESNGGTPPAPPATPPATPPVPARADMSVPPHLRPSAPTPPGHERPQAQERRQLTENEARLARERGMTHEQFLDWLEVPPDKVVHSKIGRQS